MLFCNFSLLRKDKFAILFLGILLAPIYAHAKVVVFWQTGFPVVDSTSITQKTISESLSDNSLTFANEEQLVNKQTLDSANLLVLPYGSAVPVDCWRAIESYLHAGGNLLILGGQPLRVPVRKVNNAFQLDRPQDTYSNTLGFRHSYEVPVSLNTQFVWKHGYKFNDHIRLTAKKYFAVEGDLNGLGYMIDETGNRMAAPVIVADRNFGETAKSRIVVLDFHPIEGYWQTADGRELIRTAAEFAQRGTIHLSIELLFATIRPEELPIVTIHLQSMHDQQQEPIKNKEIILTLASNEKTIETVSIPVNSDEVINQNVFFHKLVIPGFYTVTATYNENKVFRAAYQNGFWVKDEKTITSGPTISVRGNFLTCNNHTFFPVGTNYFSTESNGWDFSGPRNAWIWEQDFAEMERNNINFVRTGVWMPYGRFVEPNADGGVNERFLRNLEGFLLAAQHHHIAVNFTFFAFAPHSGEDFSNSAEPLPNPYLNAKTLQSEFAYVRSIVERFKNVSWLSWDLINEPSFSNPRKIFQGNLPNGDLDELAAWRKWLQKKYKNDLTMLATAWSVPPENLENFSLIPLPSEKDLIATRYGNPSLVRAIDYNLFAQETFGKWVHDMASLIRSTGSHQLINVGQDEGGVTDRLLNQFFDNKDLSFTTNHTYWQDDALLWDSIVAKKIGIPNITGETGYQPVWDPDGSWRYDEFTGLGLLERKWALGFAAGSSGTVQWDWDREVDFGAYRSDGSAKIWQAQIRDLGQFAAQASTYATELKLPETVIVLPQSLQLSIEKEWAIEAQQKAVRALYGDARSAAYAVGEYQINSIQSPKLILLPSSYGITEESWKILLQHVKDGSTLLITGPFGNDAHLHPTNRFETISLSAATVPLIIRENMVQFPWGVEKVTFTGSKTTYLDQLKFADGTYWTEKQVGHGKILICALPLELNDNPVVIGNAYRYALKAAGVKNIYTTEMPENGIFIVPTLFSKATLYVVTSESNQGKISFTDSLSGKRFSGEVTPGTASILLIGNDGKLLSSYQ